MTSTVGAKFDGKQFSGRPLLGNFMKNYLSSRDACVSFRRVPKSITHSIVKEAEMRDEETNIKLHVEH